MKITLPLLAKRLERFFPVHYNHEQWDERPIRALMILRQGIEIKQGYAYVTNIRFFPEEVPKGAVILCAGDPGVKAEDYELLVCDVQESAELFNIAQDIFIGLDEWNDEMRHIANHDMDLKKLLDMTRQELNLSFVYLNRSYSPVADSHEYRNQKELRELISSLMLNNEANHNEIMDAPLLLHYEELGLRCYVMNFHYNDSYRGKLLAFCPLEQEGGSWELPLLNVLCFCIRQVYRLYSASSMRPAGYLMMQRALRNLLEGYGTPADMERIRQESNRALQELQWNVNDFYVLYYLPFGENEKLATRAEYLVTMLENRWNMLAPHSSRGVALTDGICWVVNVSRPADLSFEDFQPEFRTLLEELGATCGASSVGSDFYDMHTYKVQAALAARLGAKAKPEERLHFFSDYALDYIISNATLSFPPENVLHPCLYTLTRYDKENNTEFCKTLRVYMQCQYNVLRASSLLYVHRSTFSVRLKRIESLCGIDLEDERTRLHILMSFYIMDANGISYM